jgi:phosphatidylserine/phosphatidylglycerophosphate/cardiolipin synthase-like enzyme
VLRLNWLTARLVVAAFSLPACLPAPRPTAGPPAVRVLTEPDAGPGAALALLGEARRALWMEMYLLTDEDAIAAIVARRQAGCDVRVILEPHPYLDDGANDPAFAALAAAGVTVRWANPRFALTHAKLAIVDHVRLVVLTLNLTRAGLAENREYVAVDDDPADVAAAEGIVAADLAGAVSPPIGSRSRVLVSPGGTRAGIETVVGAATSTLEIEMEELSDTTVVDGLITAVARGVAVSVGLPATGRSAATDTAAARLAAGGVAVRLVGTPPLHAKAIVADGSLVYVGSANLTTASLDDNREVGLILADPATSRIVGSYITADLGQGAPSSPGSPTSL